MYYLCLERPLHDSFTTWAWRCPGREPLPAREASEQTADAITSFVDDRVFG